MEHNHQEALDAATSRRLAQLGRHDPDVSGLTRKLDVALGSAAHQDRAGRTNVKNVNEPPARSYPIARWLRPVAGLAAMLAVVVTVFIVAGTNSPRASAAVVDLSRLHQDLIAGRIALTPVQTVAQANEWIASQQDHAPALPNELAGSRVQSCCLTDVQGELVAVAIMEHEGDTVTLVVAEVPKFAHQMGKVYEINGRTLFGHELDGIHMMMANQGDRWLCVMGDLDYEVLAQLAAEIEF
jgi:hypothetical protein